MILDAAPNPLDHSKKPSAIIDDLATHSPRPCRWRRGTHRPLLRYR